jgi:hypothetical protein
MRDWGAFAIHTEAGFWEDPLPCSQEHMHRPLQKMVKGS